MTQGLQLIRTAFAGYEDSYVIIGGTACDIIMTDNDLDFRATKDIDMVLIAEGHLREFAQRLRSFIRDGGYTSITKNSAQPHLYRFTHPSTYGYPTMIELFSRHPDFPIVPNSFLTPLHIANDISSLSAIMLNDSYYRLLQQGRESIQGISVLNEKYLIPFKAKAWLDLNAREQHGEHVDGKDLKKHKYDVFRLAQLLAPEDRVSLNDEAYHDLADFLGEISHETLPMKQLGIRGTQQDIIDLIAGVYQLSIPPRDESSTTMSA